MAESAAHGASRRLNIMSVDRASRGLNSQFPRPPQAALTQLEAIKALRTNSGYKSQLPSVVHSTMHHKRGLTCRSTGRAAACRLGRAASLVIIVRAAQAPCLRAPVSSNVSPHTKRGSRRLLVQARDKTRYIANANTPLLFKPPLSSPINHQFSDVRKSPTLSTSMKRLSR